MSEEKLLDAFGQIDERLIEEADPEKRQKRSPKKSNNSWMKWGAMAACAIVIVGVTVPMWKMGKELFINLCM